MSVSRSSVRVRSDCVTEVASHSSAGIGLFWKLDFREMMLIFGLMLLLLQTAASPIGSVEVSIICSSSGVMRVSCSSEGDPLLYSWTLNGDPLMDGNSSIDLDEGTDGDISCSVKNHVSHAQNTIRVQPCAGPTTAAVTSSLTSAVTSSTQTSECVCSVSVVFVLVWCLQLMVLLGLLGGFHIYMRHTSGKKQEDQKVRMRRFREGPEHTAEDS
ncbi:uncharacterized protein LOC107684838 isoform X1 [Sinocyclocheilus anshuiensis]|uniref:uncharacterized protein LOC107684836 isoform X3 n=1 Tax=Sinocyclocheilus anshuiensis TaxID=1608454 RepID=UPI0007BAB072|nr:PREDICTED: uncharacterized protein LOC107684836 isoform X3 [Sinocyclocheilus anshuiensis]XP_016336697.1 PREDICTED: uncharacterized protein LOC107684838 isoform X1 [Sinocyclocheilus anshuiensis]